jgi:hypothetical protein
MAKDDTTKSTNPSQPQGASAGHEASALRIGPVVWFMIGLGVATVVVFLLMTGLFDAFASRANKSEDRPSPLASERQKLPPEPRLQLAPTNTAQLEDKLPPNIKDDNPLQEMKRFRADEDAKLNSYGWVDEKSGVVHIPIDDAKKLLLEKGLTTRK